MSAATLTPPAPPARKRWSKGRKITSAALGVVLAGGAAFAITVYTGAHFRGDVASGTWSASFKDTGLDVDGSLAHGPTTTSGPAATAVVTAGELVITAGPTTAGLLPGESVTVSSWVTATGGRDGAITGLDGSPVEGLDVELVSAYNTPTGCGVKVRSDAAIVPVVLKFTALPSATGGPISLPNDMHIQLALLVPNSATAQGGVVSAAEYADGIIPPCTNAIAGT